VEEWTKAETGVGAAIAAGNQALNGIWALLVHAANKISNIILIISKKLLKNIIFKFIFSNIIK
jgi:hypothetical protein